MNCVLCSSLFINIICIIVIYSIFNVVNPESHCHYRVIPPDSEVSILYSTEEEQNKKPFYDITFVTQTTSLRLFYFKYLLTRWHGPFSITIGVNDEDLKNITHFLNSPSITYSLYKVNSTYYPINKLRNIAIRKVKTSHFFLSDMDFWPSNNLYESFHELPTHLKQDDWLSIIVPAYQFLFDKKDEMEFRECVLSVADEIPLTKPSLKECIKKSKCQRFRPETKTHNYHYDNWIDEPSSKSVVMIQHFNKRYQEPYIFIRRSEHMPMFNELFFNYGRNKVEWIEHLRYIGYKFGILVQGFGVDVPHPKSKFEIQYMNGRVNGVLPFVDVFDKVFEEIYKQPDRSVVYTP